MMSKGFKERFLKNSILSAVGQGFSMIFHFGSIMILTRVISKSDYGVYTLIFVISYFFLVLSGLGLDTTLVKFISSVNKETRKYVFSKVLIIKILSLTFFTALLFLTSQLFFPLFDAKLTDYLIYISILIILGSFRDLFFRVLQGLNLFKKYAITQIISAMSRFLLLIYFYLQGTLNLDNLILTEILTIIVTLIIEFIFIPFKELITNKSDNIELMKMIKFTIPVYFNNILGSLYSQVNLVIIGVLLTPVSIAYYDVGAKIPEAFRKMFNSYILVFFPNLSNLFSEGSKSSGEKLVGTSLNSISLVLAFATLITFLFRNEIVILLFSEKYAESSLVLSLLMLSLTLGALATLLGYTNVSAGHPKVPMKVNIVCSVISIVGSLIMIPRFGYVGAVYALIIMNAVAQVLYIIYLRRINIIVNVLRYTKPIIFLIITVLLYLLLKDDSLLVRLLSISFFLILNWFFVAEFKSIFSSIVKINSKNKL
ncbi:MAG: oligosaccharide flippase family protein [Ignavibacteria bacterium]|nr:oligosaccharide flippase family protein [Ignavibacteria bacterium]